MRRFDISSDGPGHDESGIRRAALPLLVVAGGVFLLLWPVLAGDQTLFYRDLYGQHLGTARLLHGGELPGGLLWDPLLNGGQPLLGNPNRFLLYPTRLLYIFLAPLTALNWEIALHLLLGGLGAALFARRLGVDRIGCVVAGSAYALGGFSISLTNHLGRLLAYHWLPFIALAVYAGLQGRPSAGRWRAAIPILLAVQWLTGAAELAAMAAVMVLAWALVPVHAEGGRWRILRRTAAWLLLGIGVAAIQVAPAAEMVLRSDRATQTGTAIPLTWSLHPLRFPELFIPGFCGPIDVADPVTSYWGAGLVDFGFPYLVSLYLGASVVLLAAIGWVGSRGDQNWRVLRRLLATLAVAGLILALGRHLPVVGGVLASVPGLSLVRFPVKMVLLAGLAVALLAGRGAESLLAADREGSRRAGRLAAVAAGVLLLATLAVGTGLADPVLELVFAERAAQAAKGLVAPLLHTVMAMAGVMLVALAAGHFARPARSLMLTAVVVVDLLGAATATLPMAPRLVCETPPELVAELRNGVGESRFFRDQELASVHVPLAENRAWAPAAWWSEVLPDSLATTWGVPMVFNSDAEVLSGRRMAALTRSMASLGWEGRLKLLRTAAVGLVMTSQHPEVQGLELVATHSATPDIEYALDRVVPTPRFVRWVPSVRNVSSAEEALRAMVATDFDPDQEVVRERGAPVTRDPPRFLGSLQPTVELWRGKLMAPTEGLLVAAIPWHRDLLFEVDGQPIPAERVNFAFTGLPVTAGQHRLRIIFAPRTVMWGALFSAGALLLWAAAVIAGGRRRQV